jgi:TRAP-type C4-dicarboxylate transport system substrate-binding protein
VAPIGSLIPAANVAALPFLFRSFDHLHKVLDHGRSETRFWPASSVHGFRRLTFYDSGSRSIYNSVRPVRSLADMKGPAHSRPAIRADVRHDQGAGAEPVELPYGQV